MSATSYQCIPAERAAALIHGNPALTVFDVRDAVAYQQGHIDSAAHLDQSRFMAWLKRLDKAAPVVIYCYKGNASKEFAQMFVDFRFAEVYSVDGGYEPLAAALAALSPA